MGVHPRPSTWLCIGGDGRGRPSYLYQDNLIFGRTKVRELLTVLKLTRLRCPFKFELTELTEEVVRRVGPFKRKAFL